MAKIPGADGWRSSRRSFLRAGGGMAAAAALGQAGDTVAAKEASPPSEPDWSQSMGAGVVDHPYGKPSDFEKSVIRRNVPWLTATPELSVSFTPLQSLNGIITPNGLFFERYHAGRADIDPREHRLLIHGLVERPLVLTMDDIIRFPSVSRIHFIECPANGGMEWREAQLNSLQFTHGSWSCAEWTGVKLSTLLGRSWPEEESQMDHGGRCRRRAHEPQPAARQVSRRLPRRLWTKRRSAASRTGLSAAPSGSRLGGQCQREMAAPPQGRSPAVVLARRDVEIYRPYAQWKIARFHLGQ